MSWVPLLCCLALSAAHAAEGVFTDGVRHGELLDWSAESTVWQDGGGAAPGRLRSVTWADPRTEPGPWRIALVSGGEFRTDRWRLEGDRIALARLPGIPIDGVAGVFRGPPDPVSEQAVIGGDTDQVVISAGGARSTVKGILTGSDDQGLTLDADGTRSVLTWASIVAVIPARLGTAQKPVTAPGWIDLVDGSRLPVNRLQFSQGTWQAEVPGWGRLNLPGHSLIRLRVISAGGGPLGAPTTVGSRTVPVVAPPPRENALAIGGPLVLVGGRTGPGWGLAVGQVLRWRLDGKWSALSAQLGIAAVVAAGGATVVVRKDDTEVGRYDLAAGTAPLALSIDLRGARELTIQVDPLPGTAGAGGLVALIEPELEP